MRCIQTPANECRQDAVLILRVRCEDSEWGRICLGVVIVALPQAIMIILVARHHSEIDLRYGDGRQPCEERSCVAK